MTDLPTKTDLTSGTATEAEFQSAIGDLYDYLGQLGLGGDPEALQLDSSGTMTPTHCYIQADTEGGTALTDNMTLIVPTNVAKKFIIVRSTSSGRVITMKHNQSGTGKIMLSNAVDFVLRDPSYFIVLAWSTINSCWEEAWRNVPNNIPAAEVSNVRTLLGLGTAAVKNVGLSAGQIPLIDNLGTAALVNTGVGGSNVSLNSQLGSLAFLSQVTDSQLNGTGITPGTYNSVTVNSQGRATAGANVVTAKNIGSFMWSTAGVFTFTTPADITTATVFKIILTGGGAGTSTVTGGSNGGGAGGTGIIHATGLSPSTTYSGFIGIGAAAGGGTSTGGTSTITLPAGVFSASGGANLVGGSASYAGGGMVINGGYGTTGFANVNSTAGATVGGASYWGGSSAPGAGGGLSHTAGTAGAILIEWVGN